MQKEAIVVSASSGKAWRLASDEGPYLNGHDAAPCPLSFLTTGMVSSYMNEIQSLAAQRGIAIRDVVLVLDNYYTMEGSAPDGTMIGGALPVELEVRIDADATDEDLGELLADAVHASPLNGLMRKPHTSLFSLTMNGAEIGVGRVAAIDGPAEPDPGDRFLRIEAGPDRDRDARLVSCVEAVRARAGVAGGAGSSLEATQKRTLHLRGICRLLGEGCKEITLELFSPLGSTFRCLSDEAEQFGGHGCAPDAASYTAAGIAFCFMTQLGRYAGIVRRNLDGYRIVQDAHFSPGGASGGTGEPGTADPVETHLYLDTSEGEDFARTVLDMGEQTCFLHAFCRTPLKTEVRVSRP